jgi:hypothetical protein
MLSNRWIKHVGPTKSLQDLAVTLDEPVEELVSMAQYLRQLRLAEIVPVIHSPAHIGQMPTVEWLIAHFAAVEHASHVHFTFV